MYVCVYVCSGSATIGLISPRGTLTAYNISQAEAVVIPSGQCQGGCSGALVTVHQYCTSVLTQAQPGCVRAPARHSAAERCHYIVSCADHHCALLHTSHTRHPELGWPHYYVNRECQETVLVATWPAGAKTTFELSVLSAIPPAMLTNMFAASGPAPTPKPGFPLIYDNDCLKYCAAATAPPPPVPGAGAP